jgi:hypothetical protein
MRGHDGTRDSRHSRQEIHLKTVLKGAGLLFVGFSALIIIVGTAAAQASSTPTAAPSAAQAAEQSKPASTAATAWLSEHIHPGVKKPLRLVDDVNPDKTDYRLAFEKSRFTPHI